jgi:pyruvate,water dikinase
VKNIAWLDEVGRADVGLVGGKGASLGEMRKALRGIPVPDGFVVTAEAFRAFLERTGLKEHIRALVSQLDTHNVPMLAEYGQRIRNLIIETPLPSDLESEIVRAYRELVRKTGTTDVAVRSSATIEDSEEHSFAGQHDTFLNVKTEEMLLDRVRRCFASLFTDRAISYRRDRGFTNGDVDLAVVVQQMVRSDLAASGVLFTIDPESGSENVVYVTSSYGFGELVVQGRVNPDQFYVFKPGLTEGYRALIEKRLGSKQKKLVCGNGALREEDVTPYEQQQFSISDDEVLQLARWAVQIERHYGRPMDIEWAKDGISQRLFIVQARPETVHRAKGTHTLESFVLEETGELLARGEPVGSKIGQGRAHIIMDVKEIGRFRPGEVLVTEMTDPDWEPIMKIASAIVTERGGRTCFGGDTKILTQEGFKTLHEVYEEIQRGRSLSTLALNPHTLKIEWKPILSAMRRSAPVWRVAFSQNGLGTHNTLDVTPDHRMVTLERRQIVERPLEELLRREEMVLVADHIPSMGAYLQSDPRFAYLCGALFTDGHVAVTRRRGSVTFTQKPTPERLPFIQAVRQGFAEVFGVRLSSGKQKYSAGIVRGRPIAGWASDYRCYRKAPAAQLSDIYKNLVPWVLQLDEESLLAFLAGALDGDGAYGTKHGSGRLHLYCGDPQLVEGIVLAALRLGILPTLSIQREQCYNIQIRECLPELLARTQRLRGMVGEKRLGTRLFAARQILGDIAHYVNYRGRLLGYIRQNCLIDARKVREHILGRAPEDIQNQLRQILESDFRMWRARKLAELPNQPVYNIEVQDHHTYLVFTRNYTPIIVWNCHAAIVSRELGIPCVIGAEGATQKIQSGQEITVDCSQGEGRVFAGRLKFRVDRIDVAQLPRTRTKIMMNVGIPEMAFAQAKIPNDGVGLAREEFIISSHIGIHPKALLEYEQLKTRAAHDPQIAQIIREIDVRTVGYSDKAQFFVDKLASGVAKIAAAFWPNDVIVRLSDFKSNEYASLIGGALYEPTESNPMIGWRGASRYYDPKYKDAFGLECRALKKARDEMGLRNIKVMIPFCRTPEEGKKVLQTMAAFGLRQGENDLEVYVMCEIPSNVILAEEFAEIFDGFSIGSNDLTQLTLGLDRDSELVAHIYDERNEAVKRLVKYVIDVAHRKGRKIGICGQAPSDFPEFAEFLVECGIDSISLNPDTVIKTRLLVAEKERALGRQEVTV